MKKVFLFSVIFGFVFYFVFKYLVVVVFRLPFDQNWFLLGIGLIVLFAVIFKFGQELWHKFQNHH
ncbi:hypothetical protein [Ignavigranum ruoffiae]|uniref:hypothetical protein n=1 Tax=Ignavigranum ruoffiae TaxID=89093 RepID=UPI0024ADD068|nr:hypothetical protein [Ignavigranum ruoffiae]